MATYVLVPGADGRSWYWHRVAPLLQKRGHEVIAVDPLEFQRRVVGERLGIPVEEMSGGHLVALSRPEELAERLAWTGPHTS